MRKLRTIEETIDSLKSRYIIFGDGPQLRKPHSHVNTHVWGNFQQRTELVAIAARQSSGRQIGHFGKP